MSIVPSFQVCDRDLSWFITGVDQRETKTCLICDSPCVVERDIFGPTNWLTAMADASRLHDRHECPHRELALHVQATRQWALADQLPQGTLRSLAIADFQLTRCQLLQSIRSTKEE